MVHRYTRDIGCFPDQSIVPATALVVTPAAALVAVFDLNHNVDYATFLAATLDAIFAPNHQTGYPSVLVPFAPTQAICFALSQPYSHIVRKTSLPEIIVLRIFHKTYLTPILRLN